jgi:hypothetical protein
MKLDKKGKIIATSICRGRGCTTVPANQVFFEDQEGVCFQSFHTATVSVEAPPGQSSTVSATIPVGSNVPGTVTDMLRAFSTYSVVVEAESDGMNSGLISEPARFTTLSMSELLSCKGWFQ